MVIMKNKMKVTQSCPTLWDPMDCTAHAILQARILEWVAHPFSRGSSQPRDRTWVSCIAGRCFTLWATREAQELEGSLTLLQWIFLTQELNWCGSVGKESACNAGHLGSIPGLERSPGEGKGYPLQYSGLENSMDCIVHGVSKSWTWLSNFHCCI